MSQRPIRPKEPLQPLIPDIEIRTISEKLTLDELEEQTDNADVVVDCTDNFEVRYAINDACLRSGTTLVSGAAVRLEGQLMVIDPSNPEAPCYRCLYQDASEAQLNCAETGVVAPVVGAIGTLQALETIKLIVGIGESLAGYLLTFDAKYMEWRKLKLPRNPTCEACSSR